MFGFILHDMKDFYFLEHYLLWAYQYRDYCFDEDVLCIAKVPVEKMIEVGNDLIEKGFHSDFVKNQLKKVNINGDKLVLPDKSEKEA